MFFKDQKDNPVISKFLSSDNMVKIKTYKQFQNFLDLLWYLILTVLSLFMNFQITRLFFDLHQPLLILDAEFEN